MLKVKNKNLFFILIIFFLFSFSLPLFASEVDGTISPSPQWAFGENLGWINFACDNCNVHILDTGLTGYAWSKNYGWINLSPDNAGVTNNCNGQLGGLAWSKTLGWIDFGGVTIDALGKFTGKTFGLGTPKAGKINFDCDNCDIQTDWRQCALRSSPAQVIINSIVDNTIPTISADIQIKNEGLTPTEYFVEWCVVSDIANACGGGDDVYYSAESKLLNPAEIWNDIKTATVPTVGTYYFKLVAHYGVNFSVAAKVFNAISSSGGGGGSSGGGGSVVLDLCLNISGIQSFVPVGYVKVGNDCILATSPEVSSMFNTADLNRDHIVDSIDFSILLYFWKKAPPFSNIYVDINKDNNVDSIDFSIMLSQWGFKTI